jgi:hypothetical protein
VGGLLAVEDRNHSESEISAVGGRVSPAQASIENGNGEAPQRTKYKVG